LRAATTGSKPHVITDIRAAYQFSVNGKSLADALQAKIKGEVRFDNGSRALYATDGSNYRQPPIGVVIPKDAEDVVQTVVVCRQYGAPVLPRGCGTSLAGQCCNVAVILDMSKYMNQIIDLDPETRRARVQPGVVLDNLRDAAERHNLTFAPDPSTHSHNTLGGMIGNNSCGVHSVMGGRTADNIEEMDVLTHDGLRLRVGRTSEEELERIIQQGGRRGEIYARLKSLRDRYADLVRQRYPQIPRRVSGYNLDELLPENGFHMARALVGTEGTCVTVLEATTRLVYSPPARSLLVLGYPDVYTAGDHVPEIMAHQPVGLEGIDDLLIVYMKKSGLHPEDIQLLPEGGGWLLVEFGGETKEEADERAHKLMEDLKKSSGAPSMRLYDKVEEETKIWEIRKSGLGAMAFVPEMNDTWPGWEDSAVPPDRLGDYLRDLRGLFKKYSYECSLYGHFGQGCVHTRIDFDLVTAEGIEKYRSFINEASDLVLKYGGSFSGEHGDGQSRGELLPKMYGKELVQAFREFKSIWDPEGKMNPGKVVEPYRIDENLRLGLNYNPPEPKTHFTYPVDQGSFSRAALRCVGVGECRKESGGTMCPSYMVTREEKHSTRGRARMLFEMLQGDIITGRWREDSVKEALDLCLACKGCKGDCPVNVDMATYKAEFLSHYYANRLRPRSAYSMGLIYWWSRLASRMPGLVNFLAQAPLTGSVMKRLGGISPKRQLPEFAPLTFKQWFQLRGPRNKGQPPVIVWPDTFNNFFHPEVGEATVEVLEAAGYRVVLPEQSLCCGRPLYDFGMLNLAKGLLCQILDSLRPQIRQGIPIIGMEPSCLAVFRDELINLFPHDQDAQRLRNQSYLLSEFLIKEAKDYQLPELHRKAVVHGHCQHKAIMRMTAEEKVLSKLGLDYEILDSGCCGMAGAFGFEKEKYDVSIKCGERVLLPAVRSAPKDALIIADGYSCREQIGQTTDRKSLHLAQVIQMAMQAGTQGPPGNYPESQYQQLRYIPPQQPPNKTKTLAVIGLGALVVGGVVMWQMNRRRS
jgi:FAD/FMN-containing dehydrogenase/Fe-S oxidoreductase